MLQCWNQLMLQSLIDTGSPMRNLMSTIMAVRRVDTQVRNFRTNSTPPLLYFFMLYRISSIGLAIQMFIDNVHCWCSHSARLQRVAEAAVTSGLEWAQYTAHKHALFEHPEYSWMDACRLLIVISCCYLLGTISRALLGNSHRISSYCLLVSMIG